MQKWISLICLTLLTLQGCALMDMLFPRGYGPGYEVDGDRIGTGEQAIVPRNDQQYWNGEPMDQRY